jgi:capsular exopolysaccharide synthesis family protein
LIRTFIRKSTQLALVGTRPVLELAAKRLERYFPKVKQDRAALDGAINQLKAGLKSSFDKETHLMRISYVDKDPNKAIAIVNTVADAFKEVSSEFLTRGIKSAITYAEGVIRDLDTQIRKAEAELAALPRIAESAVLEMAIKQEIENIQRLRASVNENRMQISALEERIKFLSSALSSGIVPTAKLTFYGSELVKRKQADLREKREKYRRLLERYTREHPSVKKIQEEIKLLEDEIVKASEQEQKVAEVREKLQAIQAVSDLQRQKERLLYKIESAQKMIAASEERYQKLIEEKRTALDEQTQEILAKRYGLEWELQFLKSSRKSLDDNRRALQISQRLVQYPIEEIERAQRANIVPSRSRKIIPMAIFASLIIGIGMAYLLEYLNTTVRSEHDVRRYVNLPLIGFVVNIKDKDERLLLNAAPKSPLSEMFHTIGALIQTYASENNAKTFMITSPKAEEGKSTIVTNLGVALAQSGENVIVMDCDFRKSIVHKFLEVDGSTGLSTYIGSRVGHDEPSPFPLGSLISLDEIIKKTPVENLRLIPAGPHPKNPVAFLKSEVLKQLMQEIRDLANIIIIDTPPINIAVDPVLLSPLVDGIVLLVCAGETDKNEVTFAKRLLEAARGKIIGCILNKAGAESRGYYYYYYYYDRYRYRYYRET